MGARLHFFLVSLALLSGFIGLNIFSKIALGGVRFDGTQQKIYSLSTGTNQIIASLREPVTFTFYYTSAVGGADPSVRAYGARVRELLRAYEARSNGKITVIEANPTPFTDTEDQALAAGVSGVPMMQGADRLFFGLVATNSVDEHRTIPFFALNREGTLEYEITTLLARLENPEKKRIAVITSLPWLFGPNGDGASGMVAGREIAAHFSVTVLPPDFSMIPPLTDVLFIAQPDPLTLSQQYAVDQFVMAKGRVLLLADPASLTSDQLGGSVRFGNQLGVLPPSWGLSISNNVLLDRGAGLPVTTKKAGRTQIFQQPMYPSVPPSRLSIEDPSTAGLVRGINFGAPGEIRALRRTGIDSEVLAQTSEDSSRIGADDTLSRPSPLVLLEGYEPKGGKGSLAARLSGRLASAFAAGAPRQSNEVLDGNASGILAASIQQSQVRVDIVAIADVDFLNDSFYLTEQDQPALADNANFILNALDSLSGSAAMISVRSRVPLDRPLLVLEAMRTDATARSTQARTLIETELASTQQRLKGLEAKGSGSGFSNTDLALSLTPEEVLEWSRLRAKSVVLKRDLHDSERSYRVEIERIEAFIVTVSTVLVPMAVLLIGLAVFARRQRA